MLTDRTFSSSEVLSQVPDLRGDFSRRSIKEIVAEKLALMIASGVLQAGDPLPAERELAAAFGVSRETVRGAVQSLAGRGILDVSHGARTRVVSVDVGSLKVGVTRAHQINSYDIEEVHAARLLVELQVVAEAAERIDRPTLDILERSLKEQALTLEDPLRFLICNHEFHAAIYKSARNTLLSDFVADLDTYVMEHRRRVMMMPGAIAQSVREHKVIFEALESGDRAASVAAFKEHVDRIYVTTKALMEEEAQARSSRKGTDGASKPWE